MCFYWVLFTFNKYSEFLASLVICIHATVRMWRMDFERSLWWSLEQFVFYVIVFVQYRCHFVVSLFWDMLNSDKIWERSFSWKREQDKFRQYLLPFSSECCMYWYRNPTLLLSFCVGVKFGILHHQKSTDLGFVRGGWWGEYSMWEGGRNRGMQRLCIQLLVCFCSPVIINKRVGRKIIPMCHIPCISYWREHKHSLFETNMTAGLDSVF